MAPNVLKIEADGDNKDLDKSVHSSIQFYNLKFVVHIYLVSTKIDCGQLHTFVAQIYLHIVKPVS